MSTDRTRAIIAEIADQYDVGRITVLDNPERIQATGLNAAIRQAKGQIIIRVDGHTIIAPDYVRRCVETLKTTRADNVGGAMDPVGLTPQGRAIAAAGKSPFAVPTVFHVSLTPQVTDTVYLGAWPREVFDRVGLFNPAVNINEDYELNYRIRQAGGTIYFSPTIKATYYGRQTLRALWLQYFRYGATKQRMLRLHPGSLQPRQVVAPAFVAALLVGPLLGIAFPLLLVLWGMMLVVYAGLTAFFTTRTAARTKEVSVWRVALVFPTIHLAWGLGFWAGLLQEGLSLRSAGK